MRKRTRHCWLRRWKGLQDKECGQAVEAGKRGKMDTHPEPLEGNTALPTP